MIDYEKIVCCGSGVDQNSSVKVVSCSKTGGVPAQVEAVDIKSLKHHIKDAVSCNAPSLKLRIKNRYPNL